MDLGTHRWKNPTKAPIRLRLFIAPGQWQSYVIEPGDTKEIPAQFKGAIHHVRDGVVVGGLAPALSCLSDDHDLHPALAPDT